MENDVVVELTEEDILQWLCELREAVDGRGSS